MCFIDLLVVGNALFRIHEIVADRWERTVDCAARGHSEYETEPDWLVREHLVAVPMTFVERSNYSKRVRLLRRKSANKRRAAWPLIDASVQDLVVASVLLCVVRTLATHFAIIPDIFMGALAES